jgi:hypothetical protein
MTDKARIRIAAAVTALFLAGMSAAGLAARDHQPHGAVTAATPTRAAAADGSAAAGGDEGRYDAEGYEEIEHDD